MRTAFQFLRAALVVSGLVFAAAAPAAGQSSAIDQQLVNEILQTATTADAGNARRCTASVLHIGTALPR